MHHKYTPPDVEFFIYRQAEPIADDGTSHDNGYIDPWSLLEDDPILAAPDEEETKA